MVGCLLLIGRSFYVWIDLKIFSSHYSYLALGNKLASSASPSVLSETTADDDDDDDEDDDDGCSGGGGDVDEI